LFEKFKKHQKKERRILLTLLEIATIYTDLIKVESEIPDQECHAKDQVNLLRSKYHGLLMEKMRDEGIDFYDRFDATSKAFEIVKKNDKAII